MQTFFCNLEGCYLRSRLYANMSFSTIISYRINFDVIKVGASCQFCIRYTVNGTSYWDSNSGANYALQYEETSSNDYNNKEDDMESKKESSWGSSKSKSHKHGTAFGTYKYDYLPEPPSNVRSIRNSGWGYSGYSYDNEVGFY